MSRYDAIYARQSVDRADSISVESQVEFCKREAREQIKIYTDKGYSGKNMDRPAFQALLRDMETGKIDRIIVYRLDRISRSVLDFANVIDVFQRHNIDFVSTMEKFDTGTPVGKAMLMIVMIFAQLERETIQQRVLDAYSSRSKRGFYMGGRVPFGFQLRETQIDDIRTKMYAPISEEADIVRQIFSMYAQPQTSFGDVVRHLEKQGVVKRDGKPFNRSRLRDMIVNPVYVRADCRLYDFFRSQGAQIANPPEDFIGTNGAYLYSGDGERRKSLSIKGHTLVLAPHEGLVDAGIWIACRSKCLQNQGAAKPVKAKATWLAGKLKCAGCGYALTAKIYPCKTKVDNRYYLCTGRHNGGRCRLGALNADAVDEIVRDGLCRKATDFQTLSKAAPECCDVQTVRRKARMEAVESEIAALLDKLPAANETVAAYINRRICELDDEKKSLRAQIAQSGESTAEGHILTGYMEHWADLSIDDKITVVDCFIETIHASKDRLEIKWKI